jgi:plastocyanin
MLARVACASLLVAFAFVLLPPAGWPARADTAAVSISGFVFSPNSTTVTAGDTVTWTNNDVAVHDVSDKNGTWTSGVMNQGDSFSFGFPNPGTYSYTCRLHPWMNGTVVVNAASD